jgi:exostosin family protein
VIARPAQLRLFIDSHHESDWARGRWLEIAETWQCHGHVELVTDSQHADAILITLADCKLSYPETIERTARTGSYADYPEKCFVFDTQDSPVGLFPGLYASLRRYLFSGQRHRTGCYMQSFNEFVRPDSEGQLDNFRYLFRFQGSLTSRIRSRLFAANFGRDDVLIQRTEPFWANTGSEELRGFKQQYAETLRASRFVLCPRGIGTSSFRLFETMHSGRVPVILSDAWVPPKGIDWQACALRVAEKDIARLPEICLAALPRWEGMAREAYQVWQQWFSPVGMGALVRASIEDIRRTRRLPERLYQFGWPVRTAMTTMRQTAVRTVSGIRRRG